MTFYTYIFQDTVTPSRGTRSSKAVQSKDEAEEEKCQKDEKTSTVNNAVSKPSDSTVTPNGKRQSKQSSDDNGNDAESLTSLDMDNDDLEEQEDSEAGGRKSGVKLSAILPKPSKSRNSTPASSSKKGVQR